MVLSKAELADFHKAARSHVEMKQVLYHHKERI